ncbi:hypothetical protein GWI33_017157 [Rhynchophorus ferrugineus]|uniref:ubiquitinyl hydrolase 1 n=1 Tax=Rhynchophorus ferrugineus TaxID=354439 RepID=A0A834I2H7_RHYFE|nr:hypothetical protein GWI33_017157 [Rhynchophorus ferrugineus]
MQEVINLHLAENGIKTLYTEISKATMDQEKCFILCLRYLDVIERLCKLGDRNFVTIKYSHEVSRIQDKVKTLKPILEQRYEQDRHKKQKEHIIPTRPTVPTPITENYSLFAGEYISVKQLYKAINENLNVLIIDIRPTGEYSQSKILFKNIINVPEDILVPGLSANVIEKKLEGDAQTIWHKRDSYLILVFLDWNSSSENVPCSKLNFVRASVTEWDILRNYKQPPVILNGGFKEFLDSYPSLVTNVHVNFIRHNEDIDELLELEDITYPAENAQVMQLKQFTIQELEDSVNIPDSDEDMEVTSKESDSSETNESANTSENDSDMILPKVTNKGSTIDKPSLNVSKEESLSQIKNKIEEERIKLLNEARNKKNKILGGKEDFKKGSQGDAFDPPPVRRETKPRRQIVAFGGWCGLVNLKNTCYMNTVLQCLKCIPIIRNILHSNFAHYITRRPPQVINEFAVVIRALSDGTEYDKKIFRPNSFYDKICKLDPIYKKGHHEDCMEFFLFLFNHLNDDCACDLKKKSIMIEREKSWYGHLQGRTSFWVDLFYHQFQCTKVCQVCDLKADSYETDNTLMLSVPYRPGLRSVNLKQLIDEYMEDNQILDYKCSRCHQMKVTNRRSVVVEPEILVIVLKRYYQDEYQETRKNNICVNFDLSFKFGGSRYKLYSVAQHRGTMDHGHYYGHGIVQDNVWVEFNDERIKKFEKDWDSIRGSACAFFYCKEKNY